MSELLTAIQMTKDVITVTVSSQDEKMSLKLLTAFDKTKDVIRDTDCNSDDDGCFWATDSYPDD